MNQRQPEIPTIDGRPPRIAASSYLNSAPLIWSFIHGTKRDQVELITDAAPAVCADMLARGEVSAALVPVIEYQRIPELAVVADVCIASRSLVKSVVLVVRKSVSGLNRVQSVALDVSSRTSAALVQILFREFFGFEPAWATAAPNLGSMLETNDAALVIGDPAIAFNRNEVVVYDLAQLWRDHTGVGFVFAMWMTGVPHVEAVRQIDFAAARDEGSQHIGDIARLYESLVDLERAEIESYLKDNITYEIDDELRAGLDLFYKLAHKHGIISRIKPLEFLTR